MRKIKPVGFTNRKFARVMLPVVMAAAVFARQGSASPATADDAPVRAEIQTIAKLLPQLPDRAPALFQLAHDYAQLGDLKKGMQLLQQCISLHEGFDPETDPAFARVKEQAGFKSLIEQVHRDFSPVHHARFAFTVPENDYLPEGLAVDPRQHFFYLGSLNRKMIIRITRAGAASDFVPSGRDDLQSICGIKVDPQNEDVWANTCPDSGKGAELVHVDLAGKLLERFHQSTPGPHLLNDLVLRNSDEIYVTDSLSHQALRFSRKSHAFAALPLSRPLYYPNGIALSADGHQLYVADAFGVLQYDVPRQKAREVQAGAANTISGFDGLYWYRGTLLGIQNSLGMSRVAQFRLSPDGSRVTATKILEYRSDYVELPTTGAIDGSNFYFMSNTQVDNWKNDKILDPSKLARVRIAVIPLD